MTQQNSKLTRHTKDIRIRIKTSHLLASESEN